MIKPTGFLSIWLLRLALVGCATLPENVDRPPSKAFTDTGNTAIGSAIAKETSDHPDQSGFLLLENGVDAFVARAVLARFAESSIDVQYYLYHDDLVGRLFTDQLVQAPTPRRSCSAAGRRHGPERPRFRFSRIGCAS